MKFEEFMNQLRASVEEFSFAYYQGANAKPDMFPLEMSENDWWEQYNAYLQSKLEQDFGDPAGDANDD